MNKLRFFILKFVPEVFYPILLKRWYKKTTGYTLDLKHPKTFNEKIQWLKLYDRNPLKTKLADKYEVREWVKEKIGEEYLIPLLGVWDRFEDIDFDKLPNQFVLKANHGCGMNIIVRDKSKFDKKDAKQKFKKWLKTNFAFSFGYQLHYKNIKPKIIAEKYMEQVDNQLNDYKFFCFDGNFKMCYLATEHFSNKTGERQDSKISIFDRDWQKLPVKYGKHEPVINKEKLKPQNYEKMIELAEILSKGINFVRVDFYEVKGKIYFGEMTFTPGSGTNIMTPKSYDLELGSYIHLPCDKDIENK